MTSTMHSIPAGSPLLRRWMAIVMLFFIPLQGSWAAMHEYVEHSLGADSAETTLFHTHHHADADHDHHPGGAPDRDDASGRSHAAELNDGDTGHIHPGHVAFIASALAIPLSGPTCDRIGFEQPVYPSIPPRRLDRPPLLARR